MLGKYKFSQFFYLYFFFMLVECTLLPSLYHQTYDSQAIYSYVLTAVRDIYGNRLTPLLKSC